MKKYAVIIIGLSILFILGILLLRLPGVKNETTGGIEQKVKEVARNVGQQEFHPPYSIEDLRIREYSAGDINIEETISTGASFSTHIISYESEGLKQFSLMKVPNTDDENYPVIIVNHGYVDPDVYSTTNSYDSVTDAFASESFLVLKPDYRNHADSEGEDVAINRLAYAVDVLSLISGLDSIEEADTNNIFLYGHSMGGEVVLRVLTATDVVKAATLWAPVGVEFPESLMYFVRKHRSLDEIREVEQEIADMYDRADYEMLSPTNYLSYIEAELNIHHGTSDTSVPFSWSTELVEKLKKEDVDYTFYEYEGADHNLRPNFSQAVRRDVEFFRSFIE